MNACARAIHLVSREGNVRGTYETILSPKQPLPSTRQLTDMETALRIRLMVDDEADSVAEVWHRTGLATYQFIESWKTYTLEQAREGFRKWIAAQCSVWVAEGDGLIVGYLALNGSYLDRLYVSPSHQRQGVGTHLLRKAIELSPEGLELHTHQRNTGACAFYEKNGFLAVKYGVSPPPESEPDVEFHWRPERHQPRIGEAS